MKKHQKPVHPSRAGKAPASPRKRESAERSWPEKGQPQERLTEQVEDIHRTMPHSIEAEQGVLGSMLISPREVIAHCVEVGVTTDHFYVPANGTIFTVLIELWREQKGIDLITFTQVLRDRKTPGGGSLLETVGGAGYVTGLFTFVPTAANVTYYLEIVLDKYILREVIAACTESVQRAFVEQDETWNLLDEVERKILSIRPLQDNRESDVKEDVMEAVEVIEQLYERKGAVSGIATGFAEFDRMTSGLQDQEMIVIAARPSMGKTALAMNIVENVTINLGLPVAVFSLEMSKQQLMQRQLCSLARVNLQKVRDGFLSERDFPALTAAASKIAGSKLYVNDQKLMIDGLVARARRLKQKHDIKLIVVDYLQLLTARGFKADHRTQEVAYISGALKGVAKDLRIPVLVLAQLNRQPETRHGGKPRLSDLRESGSIEQDADLVGLLVRGEVYEDDEDERNRKQGEAELIIAKQRNGPIGECYLTFLKEFTRFEDRARSIQGVL